MVIILTLTHFILGTPKGVLAKSADPDQMPIMWHLIWVFTILQVVQPFSNKNILINIARHPLN